MLQLGRNIGDYFVEAVAGRGARAVVYRVRHRHTYALQALKVVDWAEAGLLDRFALEVRAQARLRHANVVGVAGVLDVDGQPGLLMEYVPGSALGSLFSGNATDLALVDVLFGQVCSGVAAAHALRMVHRDVKPDNVLVCVVNGELLAKVSDFGIVKVLGSWSAGGPATRSFSTMGTPGYMAPEQLLDAKRVDERADVFSLGCLLYRMLTGSAPFQGELQQVGASASRGEYPPLEERRPGVPQRYVVAIRACLQPQREARPPDVEALLAMLAPTRLGA
jgi:serine/threonine protein kinase